MDRYAEARTIFGAGMEKVRTTKPPKGQKFPPGTRVRIANDLGPTMAHFPSGRSATVEYTYAHAYGGGDCTSYSLDIDGLGSHAWYHERQLTRITKGDI